MRPEQNSTNNLVEVEACALSLLRGSGVGENLLGSSGVCLLGSSGVGENLLRSSGVVCVRAVA